MSRPRALRGSPRSGAFPLVRGLHFGWSPMRCRASSSILRSEPRFPSPRTLRGSRPPRRLGCRPFCVHPSRQLPLLRSGVLYAAAGGGLRPLPSSPAIALTILPAGWGGALGAAERAGRRNPRFGAARYHRDALAGWGSVRRVDRGRGKPSTPLGRAAERARSAARASPGSPIPPACSMLPPRGGRRPPTFVSPAMPPAGWLGGVRIRQRTDLRR